MAKIWERSKDSIKILDRFEFKKLQRPPIEVPAQVAADLRTPDGRKMLTTALLKAASVFDKNRLAKIVADSLSTSYYRRTFYRECLTGDTLIPLIDGRYKTIRDLVEEHTQGKVNYVYSVDVMGKKFVRSKILDIWKQPDQKQTVKVILDNGRAISCTPDHLFMLRNGAYKEAGALESGDSLMPLYRWIENIHRKGYWMIFDPFSGRDRVQYRYFNKVLKFHDVHHNFVHFKDSKQNKLDDTPENHVICFGEDHDRLHVKYANQASRNPEVRAKAAKTYREKLLAMTHDKLVAWVKKARGTDRPEIEAKRLANLRESHKLVTSEERKRRARLGGVALWAKRKVEANNHKVKSVEWLGVADVYDLSVEPFHNFAVAAGVFVHNCEQASSHTLVSAALDLYIDQVTGVSPITNRAVWATSEDKKVENTLNQFLDEIAVEEHLRDWASTLGMFGDLFIEAIAREGIGVAYLDDSMHPADFERIDINGRLEGFIRTGLYSNQSQYTAELEAPWRYVHFRIFGATRRTLNTALGIFGETGRTFSLERDRMSDRMFRVTTKYGSSLLTPVVPIYKRLKLCEDTLIMARMTRGILWYLYKINIKGGNIDSMAEMVANYAEYLKRSTGLNVDETSPTQQWTDRWSALFAQIEDLYFPESEDVTLNVEPLGGQADIKAIVDIDMLQNQLLGALRVSRAMLGITDELPGALGEGASRRISINFAKNAQRLQVGLRNGIKRLCQIHLAFLGQPCDPSRFDVNFAEINSAEEEELKSALDRGVDVAGKIADFLVTYIGDDKLDRMKMLTYINDKFLKLPDLDFSLLVKKIEGEAPLPKKVYPRMSIPINSDLFAYLPGNRIFRIAESNGDGGFLIKEEKKIWTPTKATFMPTVEEKKV